MPHARVAPDLVLVLNFGSAAARLATPRAASRWRVVWAGLLIALVVCGVAVSEAGAQTQHHGGEAGAGCVDLAEVVAGPNPDARVVHDARLPAELARAVSERAPVRPDATSTSARAGEGAGLVNARHLGRARSPRLGTRTLRAAVLSARRDDLPEAPLLATPILPRLKSHTIRRAEAQGSPFMGPWTQLKRQWREVKRALDVTSIYGVKMARVPLPATDERLLVSRDVVWFDVTSPFVEPDPLYDVSVSDDDEASMRVGPYLGGWGSALNLARGGGELRGDVGMRLGLEW